MAVGSNNATYDAELVEHSFLELDREHRERGSRLERFDEVVYACIDERGHACRGPSWVLGDDAAHAAGIRGSGESDGLYDEGG